MTGQELINWIIENHTQDYSVMFYDDGYTVDYDIDCLECDNEREEIVLYG